MAATGKRIRMTKGYKGAEGLVTEATNSRFEFYVIALDNGLNIVAGPSAFEEIEGTQENETALP